MSPKSGGRQARLILVAGLFGVGLTDSAAAQSSPTETPVATFQGVRAVSGFRTEAALSGDWQVIDFFVRPNREVRLPDGRPSIEHVARRLSGAAGGAGSVSWATSRDCPTLYNTLVWMSVLEAPRIEIAGVTPSYAGPAGRRPVTIFADGTSVTVWGRGTQPDHTVNTRVEISSNGGLIAEFGKAATDNLAPCWRPDQPVF